MQYLLSETEYNALVAAAKKRPALSDAKLQKLCTKIANEMPVKWGWGGPDPKPWGCMLTKRQMEGEWYCDSCPVNTICPADQEYSK